MGGYLTVQLTSIQAFQVSPKEQRRQAKRREKGQREPGIYKSLKEKEWQVPRTEKYSK